MTEAEWLACDDPRYMLRHLTHEVHRSDDAIGDHPRTVSLLSERKARLFACAVAWLAHGGTSGQVRENVRRAYAALERGDGHHLFDVPVIDLVNSELGPALADRRADAGLFAAALRCVVGNPFRPLTPATMSTADALRWYEWLTPAVLGIACRAYDERDFAALPVLADALEEAGCEEETVLRHLRGWAPCPVCLCADPPPEPGEWCTYCGTERWEPWGFRNGPHMRGCWVLDLVLGKE